ncbi:MAG: YfhO family protein [Eubacteriales bacterium]|nr:YfhO family protein [Eubacteriales bacterium]
MEQKIRRIDIKTLLWIWGLLGTACLLIFHSYILGNETFVFSDVGSDTKEQYVMHFNSIVNGIRSGSFSLWDFSNGFGVNRFVQSLTSPLLLLFYGVGALFGPEAISTSMVWLIILEVMLAGTTCYFFLSEFELKEKYKLAACLMYGLNGFLMVWGQHYQMGNHTVFLPLLLMCIEKALRNRRACFGVALTSALLILSGYYQGYMCMLGGGIYVCLRVLLYEDAPWKKKWKDFASTAAAMGFGVIMGAVNLLPSAATQVGETTRLNSNLSLLERVVKNLSPWPREYYKTLMYRLFGSNLQGNGNYYTGYQNYYEAVNLFFSTLFIILVVQYVLTIHRCRQNKLQKAAQYIGVAFAAFMVVVPTGSLIFNGFAYAFGRHTFLLMPMFALLCAVTLQRIMEEKELSLPGLALSVAAILLVYGKAYRYTDAVSRKGNALILCLTGLAMAGILLWSAKKKQADLKICYLALGAMLFVNLVSDAALCCRDRDTVKKNDTGYYEATYHSSVQDALAWIEEQDDSFYRVEKDFHTASGCLDSMAQGYYGVSTYNSTRNANTENFVQKLWPQLMIGYDRSHYQFSNTVREQTMASLVGVKYLLSHSGDLEVEGYELCHQTGDIYIYRNTDTDSIGKFFTRTVSREAFEEMKRKDIWKLLKDVLILEDGGNYELTEEELAEYEAERIYLLDESRVDQETNILTEDGMKASGEHFLTLPLRQEILQEYENVAVEFTLETNVGTEIEVRMNDGRSHVSYHYAGKKKYRFAVPQGTEQITIQITNAGVDAEISGLKFRGSLKDSEFSKEAVIEIKSPEKDSRLEGSIHAETAGMVMLAIPYENGWSVRLNGQEQELLAGDYGFIAFEVQPGDYTLEVQFEAPMFKTSLLISLVSLGIFVVLWILSSVRKSNSIRRKEGKNK